jgi:transposase
MVSLLGPSHWTYSSGLVNVELAQKNVAFKLGDLLVLTRKSEGGKLERVDPTQKGKRSCKRRERTFTREFKGEAVQLAQSSKKPLTQIARDLGIADSTLHHWCKLFADHGERAFPGSGHQTPQEEEMKHLKREVDVLRQERDILKKALGIFSRSQL